MYLSGCLLLSQSCTYVCTYVCVHVRVYLWHQRTISVCLSVCLSVRLSVSVSLSLSDCLSVSVSVSLSLSPTLARQLTRERGRTVSLSVTQLKSFSQRQRVNPLCTPPAPTPTITILHHHPQLPPSHTHRLLHLPTFSTYRPSFFSTA